MSPVNETAAGKVYWRSLDDLADAPELRELVRREFPAFADEMLEPSRRNFLKLMGASVALAGMTACRRWPAEQLAPFAHRPEGYVPGATVDYATAWEIGGAAVGLLVASYDGRPVKIEGNPLHPASLGATSAQAQAVLLEMYDPDRSQGAVEIESGGRAQSRTWDDFAAWAGPLFAAHRASGGSGLRVLSEPSSSPTLADLRERFRAVFPRATWHEYEPLSRDREREGAALAFGRTLRAQYDLSKARVVVALEADLLGDHPTSLANARAFARWRRAPGGEMNRLWAVEATYTITGGAADHRVPVASRKVAAVAGHLAQRLLEGGLALPAGTEPLRGAILRLAAVPLDAPASRAVEAMAQDLLAHRGAAVVAAGPKQPPAVHALVHVLNAALGNAGAAVTYTADPDPARPSHVASIRDLADAMLAGQVETLLILGGNPAFDAPADLDFAGRLGRVRNAIHLSAYRDETSLACRWHVPRAHVLEAWGDARAWDGTISVVQPLIEPLFGGKTPLEMVALATGDAATKGYDLVRRAHQALHGGLDFEKAWRRALHDGLVRGSAFAAESAAPVAPSWSDDLAALADVPEGIEVVFERDAKLHDGRFANNGWLQEMPDPISKMTWDNPAWIGPGTAADLRIESGDVVRIQVDGRAVEVPVFVVPGQARGTVALFPGAGRRSAGRVADGVGFDLYPVRTSGGFFVATAAVQATGARHRLATTQDHHVVDALGQKEREIRSEVLIREAELETYREEPDFAKHAVHIPRDVHLWEPHAYDGYKWGMAVDLTACIGCGACTVACQAENNIPVVGKDEVLRGREMHWIRVDRYFRGDPEAPALAFQPLTCHHCENAPCEQVCPVAATVHDHEGLNVMVYNRCIGTRYCSNNCPYKVRRFNWFNNHKSRSSIEMMVYNPEVTLRARGVMEKCTFCVQRIEHAKIAAKNDGRRVRDGEVVTACQQACPTEAIAFGDLNDPESRVRGLHDDARTYGVLEEINTKPRLKYMARLRNRSGHAGAAGEGKA